MACALVGATIIVNPNRVDSWRKPKSLIEYLLGADPRCICDCCPYGEAISSAIIVDFFFLDYSQFLPFLFLNSSIQPAARSLGTTLIVANPSTTSGLPLPSTLPKVIFLPTLINPPADVSI
jgi:hypothetical protein